jgi:hypothetical protein
MTFKRIISIQKYPKGEELTSKLNGIGFRLSGKIEKNVNIEDCLIAACIEGMSGDFRLLSLLTDWLFIHFKCINSDRLYRALMNLDNKKVRCYFHSVLRNFKKEFTPKKFLNLYRGPKIILGDVDLFLVTKNGEDERFINSKLIVPNKMLRQRADDILTVGQLAKIHNDYFYRLLIGPSYRADMISNFLTHPNISPTELAKVTYGSFATAWEIINEISQYREIINDRLIAS